MAEVAQIDEHISGFKTSMEKLNARLDELKKEEETIHQAIKKYEGALEYASILRGQIPEKVEMNDVQTALPSIPETKAEEVNEKENSPSATGNGAATGGDVKDQNGIEKSDTASGSKKKKKR